MGFFVRIGNRLTEKDSLAQRTLLFIIGLGQSVRQTGMNTRPQQPARSTASEGDKSTIQQPEKKDGADQATSSNPGVPKNK